MKQKVLMLGWELPPYNSGGLGVACLGLCRAMAKNGADVTFVLPKKVDLSYDFMKLMFANVKVSDSLSSSYTTSVRIFNELIDNVDGAPWDFVSASLEYAKKIGAIVKKLNIDLIHAHDWMTFPAAVAAQELTGKPLIVHVHSTEVDRTGGHYPNKVVYSIEKAGLEKADKIISVSEFTKNIITGKYGIDASKIAVVHNGLSEINPKKLSPALPQFKKMGFKIVLFLGRITLMKGPEYFIRAAKKVLEYHEKTIFVVVGSGDMQESMMSEAASLGIIDKVMFTGFLRGDEKDRIFQTADLYVMPSVSEPFGIVPLEAISNGTPVMVSKQTGVSEILQNALKVDFWDIDEMANKIVAVLKHPELKSDLVAESSKELPNINWDTAAQKCMRVYKTVAW